MYPGLTNKMDILRDRAAMLARSRRFFEERNILEVDVPLLNSLASVDLHIDLIAAHCMGKKCFLHSSPEYGMKRLIAIGSGDIYQLCHVFRDGDLGDRHHPEFMMAEWYRLGFSFSEMIEETVRFLRIFITESREVSITYRDAFERFIGYLPQSDDEQDYYFSFEIAPRLGHDGFTILKEFPASKAALAQKFWNGKELVAERFEIFYQGIELANGYHELADAEDQRARLEEANKSRGIKGKETYPIDTHFLAALSKGFPDCCGVAVGVDRLMMLRHKTSTIKEIMPITWSFI
jgi:lysyl-tRNA synthetase class 2